MGLNVDYLILQNGTEDIQSFFNVSSFSPKEALDISLKSLDILIAFELESKKIPKKIRECLLAYSKLFLKENSIHCSIKNILNNKKERVNIQDIINLSEIDAANGFIFHKIFLNGLDVPKNIEFDLFELLIIYIKNFDFYSALIILLVINEVYEVNNIIFSQQESILLKQAYHYISTFSESTENHRMKWLIKILKSKESNYE